MTALLTGKHIVEEINGIRCSLVESNLDSARLAFLEALMKHNGYQTQTEALPTKTADAPPTYKLGVVDLIFNPVKAIYEKALRRPDGMVVTPAYWREETKQTDRPYYLVER
jgi:hypothetical protein